MSEQILHARRESTFLALGTMFLIAIAVLAGSGITRVIDLSATLEAAFPRLAMPVAVHVPFGIMPGVVGVLAIMLACELYGRRRAGMLVWAGIFATAALVGLAAARDAIDGDQLALAPALALAAYVVVAHVTNLFVFDALGRGLAGRHSIVRVVLASFVAQPLGWAAFGAVMFVQSAQTPADLDAATSLAVGSALFTLAAAIILAPLFALAARALAVFLRVARFDARRPAVVTEDEPVIALTATRTRARRATLQEFSNAELQFFAEGERA